MCVLSACMHLTGGQGRAGVLVKVVGFLSTNHHCLSIHCQSSDPEENHSQPEQSQHSQEGQTPKPRGVASLLNEYSKPYDLLGNWGRERA